MRGRRFGDQFPWVGYRVGETVRPARSRCELPTGPTGMRPAAAETDGRGRASHDRTAMVAFRAKTAMVGLRATQHDRTAMVALRAKTAMVDRGVSCPDRGWAT
ncbi:hypothetical protein GCM10027610_128210 [Dactylosporangium cerinum]